MRYYKPDFAPAEYLMGRGKLKFILLAFQRNAWCKYKKLLRNIDITTKEQLFNYTKTYSNENTISNTSRIINGKPPIVPMERLQLFALNLLPTNSSFGTKNF